MTLRDAIVTDAAIFANDEDFAELVVYYPRGGGSRSIKAVVFRSGYELSEESGSRKTTWEVHVANSATTGITSTEVSFGSDQLALAPRPGEALVKKLIAEPIDHDEGMLVFLCR